MNSIRIIPAPLLGKVHVPPSKSFSHRGIIAAGIAKGKSILENIDFSDDILATCQGMQALGSHILQKPHSLEINGHTLFKNPSPIIDCHESGSTLRFLIPLALLSHGETAFHGSKRLGERPLEPYYEIFDQHGIKYTGNGLPLTLEGHLKPGLFDIRGDISSQFITGLMFALPLLSGDSTINITHTFESKSYIDLTIHMLEQFGIHIDHSKEHCYSIKGNQTYQPTSLYIEGDYSQAAFWIIAGTLNGQLEINGLNKTSMQGDRCLLNIIEKMGGCISHLDNTIFPTKSHTYGLTLDVSQCPDLVPILAVLGALSQGTTTLLNAHRLRLKESDRLQAISAELLKIGADIRVQQDSLIINGRHHLNGGVVDSWNDHRIAMALAIASVRCTNPLIIKNHDVINKSYPNFFKDFNKLGGQAYACNLGE